MCLDSQQSREAEKQIQKLRSYEGLMLSPTFDKESAMSNVEKLYGNMFSNLATTTSEALRGSGVPLGEGRSAVMTNAVAPLAAEKFTKLTDILKYASQEQLSGRQLAAQLFQQQGQLASLLSSDTGLGTALGLLKFGFGMPAGIEAAMSLFSKDQKTGGAGGLASTIGKGSYDPFADWFKSKFNLPEPSRLKF